MSKHLDHSRAGGGGTIPEPIITGISSFRLSLAREREQCWRRASAAITPVARGQWEAAAAGLTKALQYLDATVGIASQSEEDARAGAAGAARLDSDAVKCLRALNTIVPQMDNGYCAICRLQGQHGYRSADTKGRVLVNCSNVDCLSYQIAAVLDHERRSQATDDDPKTEASRDRGVSLHRPDVRGVPDERAASGREAMTQVAPSRPSPDLYAQGVAGAARLDQGCACRCCDHSEGSDCACDCHATGACAWHPEPNPAAGAALAPLEEHIWCDICQAVEPLVRDFMPAGGLNADAATDLLCGECRSIVATLHHRAARAGDPARLSRHRIVDQTAPRTVDDTAYAEDPPGAGDPARLARRIESKENEKEKDDQPRGGMKG